MERHVDLERRSSRVLGACGVEFWVNGKQTK